MKTVARKLRLVFLLALFFLATGTIPVRAQDPPQSPTEDKPKPAGSSFPLPPVTAGDQQDQNSGSNGNLTPDTNPLTGVQTPTLGSPEILHSYWVPGIQWSGSIQSNSYNQTANSSWVMNNYFIGNLSLLKVWSGSQLAINYSGGGFFSSDSSQGNGTYHQLAFSQTFQWNRWLVQFLDQFSYLPQSAFGFGGGTGLGLPGAGGSTGPTIPGMGNGYVPNQSIVSSNGSRYSNASTAQITYSTSPRGSITLSGTYALLNFVEAGNVDNNTTIATVGYNYTLTRADSIGAFYRFSAYHFNGQPEAFGDQSVNFAYSRKLTGRLALQLYGGPEFTSSRRTSLNPGSLTYGVNAGANLRYGFKKGGVSVGYIHGLSGGSGVLTGSSVDQVNSSATHNLGRIWTGQLNFGYAHNSPVTTIGQANNQSYNDWTAGGGVSRAAGRNATLAIAYNATINKAIQPGCVGSACSSSQTFHFITINFQWHTRPFVLP